MYKFNPGAKLKKQNIPNLFILFIFISLINLVAYAESNNKDLSFIISNKKWCLDDSYTHYLDSDPKTPLTDVFEFKSGNKLIYTLINKLNNEIYTTINGTWSLSNDKLTLSGNGQTNVMFVEISGNQLILFNSENNQDLSFELYNDCSN